MLSSSSPPEIDGLDPDAGLLAELEATRARLRRAEQARGAADHRIANRLQLAAAFLKAERRRAPHEAARLALLTAEARLHGVARLHRRVSGQIGGQIGGRDGDGPGTGRSRCRHCSTTWPPGGARRSASTAPSPASRPRRPSRCRARWRRRSRSPWASRR